MKLIFGIVLASIALIEVCIAYGGYGHGYGHGHSINAAIISHHSVHSIPYHSDGGNGHVTHVNIDGGVAPIAMHFRTYSSPIKMTHSHYNHHGSYGHSMSYDKPHYHHHTVHKPVIHQLSEIIHPKKIHLQIVRPVHKSVLTKVFAHHHYGHY